MSYTERYVAFIDILGFKGLIRRSMDSEQMVKALAESLNSMGKRETKYVGEDLRALNFSDTILMSEKVTAQGLSCLLFEIQELALSLLPSGFLIRGGISKGSLYHEGSVVFGPALIEAYRLESTVANVPRIILGRDVYSDVTRYGKEDNHWKKHFASELQFSDDGPVHVHVLKRLQRLNREGAGMNTAEVVQAELCQSALQGLIDHSMHEPRHFEKVKWFAIYWNGNVPCGESDALLGMVSFPYMIRR
jgi:hypothetical protein